MNNRNQYVDSLRGLACLLVVGLHTTTTYYTANLIDRDSYLIKLTDFLTYIRMPLFTFLSGYVYSIRPVISGRLNVFFIGKVKRILIPLFFVGTSVSIIIALFGTSGDINFHDALFCFIKPVGVYWFLWAIFIIYIFFGVLDVFQIIDRKWKILSLLLISLFIRTVIDEPTKFFAFDGVLYLFPFFTFGVVLHRYNQNKANFLFYISMIVVALAGFNILFPVYDVKNLSRESIFNAFISLSFCYVLFFSKIKSKFLCYIGSFSYSIYLFHVLFAVSPRIIWSKSFPGIEHPVYFLIFAGLFFGVFCPILIDKMAAKYKITSVCFLGRKLK